MVLQALSDERERRAWSPPPAAAQVREFTLRLKLQLPRRTPAGRELIARPSCCCSRDLTYSENFALAKQQRKATSSARCRPTWCCR